MQAALFNHFCTEYFNSSIYQLLGPLRLNVAELRNLYLPFSLLGSVLESSFQYQTAGNRMINAVEIIKSLLNDETPQEKLNFLIIIVNDLIILPILSPSFILSYNEMHKSQVEYVGELRRFSLHPLAASVALEALDQLATFCHDLESDNAKYDHQTCIRTGLLGHIIPEEYCRLRIDNLPLALLQLSLANYTSDFRNEIVSDKLCLAISRSPALLSLMMSCGNSHEQHFLNTCDAAACLNALIHHHSHIGTLLCLSRKIIAYMKQFLPTLPETTPAYAALWNFWFFRPPSIRTFATRIIVNVENNLAKLESKVLQFLDSAAVSVDSSLKINTLEQCCLFVEEWSHQMQALSAAFVPSCPVVTTVKPFSQQWHLSAASMTIWSTLAQLAPGSPHYLIRARAAHQLEDVPCYLLHTFSTVLDSQIGTQHNYVRFARRVQQLATAGNAPEVIDCVQMLWNDIKFYGGALFSSSEAVWSNWWVGHVSFVLALTLPAEIVPLLKFNDMESNIFDDGSSESLKQRLLEKFKLEDELRRRKAENNDLLHPRDAITFSANKKRFSWFWSILSTFLPFLQPRAVEISLPSASSISGAYVRCFLIADPEIKHYKLLTFEQAIELVRHSRNAFDMCNLSPWHKQIAMI